MEPAAFERLARRRRVLQVALHGDVALEHDLAERLAVARHRLQRRRIQHRQAFLQLVAHALAAVHPHAALQVEVAPRRAGARRLPPARRPRSGRRRGSA